MKVTFIGHSTTLIELGGKRFLTDPIFSDRVHLFRRRTPMTLATHDLPKLAAVLVSHAHYDHLDLPTLSRLDGGTPLLVPRRNAGFIKAMGNSETVELGPGDCWKNGDVEVHAVPARHFGGRWLVDSFLRPANGYVIRNRDHAVYFAGDTARANSFREIGDRFRPSVALLPIGAYRPRWIMRWSHMDPEEALSAFHETGARFMIPIHWGAFRLSMEPVKEPVQRLRALIADGDLSQRVVILGQGKSWEMP